MAAIILDTCIISEAYLPQPPLWLLNWLDSLPPGSVVVPWLVLYETEYGIRLCERSNPTKAAYVLDWFEEFLQKRMVVLDMNVEGARLLGRMAACPALRHMFETPALVNRRGERIKNEKIKIGADAMIAAMSIAHGIPVASFNTRDFVYINKIFPLPGLYDPRSDDWIVDPPVGWGMTGNANDDKEPDHGSPYRLMI